jgi:uncharacterized protein involved in outer membrane biogenesis
MNKLLGIVGAVIATLLGLVVLLAVVAVVLLNSGALNGVIEEAVAAQVGRPARLEKAPLLGFKDGALTLEIGPLSVANAEWAADQHPEFARIQVLQASLRLLPLLRGTVESSSEPGGESAGLASDTPYPADPKASLDRP